MPATHIRFGSESRVNTATDGSQGPNYTTALMDGGWVVTWTKSNLEGTSSEVLQQRFDASGAKVGTEFIVNTTTQNFQSSSVATGLADGGWVVAWVSVGQDGSSEGVFQQRYDVNGERVGAETQVNGINGGSQTDPSITVLPDGGWVVTYTSELPGGSWGIYQTRFDAEGSIASDKRIDNGEGGAGFSSVAVTTTGWVVTYTARDSDGDGIYQLAFDHDGNEIGTPTIVNSTTAGQQRDSHVMGLADGGWVVFWSHDTGEGKDFFQQHYDATGTKVGGETLVNHDTRATRYNIQSTLLSDDTYVVTWEERDRDGSGYGIYQQVFSASGSKIGDEILVNETTTGHQSGATVTALAGGGWVVSWDSEGQNGSGYSINQRVFSQPEGLTLTAGKDYIVGTAGNETINVTAGGLDGGDEVHGGDGLDTLQLSEAGTLDLRSGALSSIEALRGSEGNDTFILKSGLNTGLLAINGEGGNDVIQVQSGATDLSTVVFSNIEKVQFDEAGSVVKFNFWDQAKLVLASKAEGVIDEVILAIDIVTNARILQLFKQGIDIVTDSNGSSFGVIPIALDNEGGTTKTTADVPVKPFSKGLVVTVAYRAEVTAIVKLDDPAKGKLIPSSLGGSYDAASGTFTIKGTADAVGKAIEALTFDPADGGKIGSSATTTFTVTVTDGLTTETDNSTLVEATVANLAPESISLSSTTVLENSTAGTVVATLSATDPNMPESFTFEIIGDAAGRFAVSGNTLVVKDGVRLDYEQATSHDVTLRVKDALGLVRDEAFKIQVGDVANEIAKGSAGNDVLKGGTGKDRFYGGLGNDALEGGKGQDIFVFNTKTNKKTNVDTIKDFSVKDDTIWLDNAIFKKLGKSGSEKKPAKLSKDFFTIGIKAADAKDYLIYNKKTGSLSYDADGSGKGAAVQIAKLAKNLKLTEKDFFVV
ncbi:cadherin domain-containing protein [Microvirga sp. 2MCAF38]|uniref:cadherin repeat domain-containing protein n=1 Tax=Microvirga sp. 2MCAF38 TaxID=3232989 RepID=UPI003F95D404